MSEPEHGWGGPEEEICALGRQGLADTSEVRACVMFRDLSAEIAASRKLALLEQRDRISSEVPALVLTRVSAALVELDGLIGRVQEELVLERLTPRPRHAR